MPLPAAGVVATFAVKPDRIDALTEAEERSAVTRPRDVPEE